MPPSSSTAGQALVTSRPTSGTGGRDRLDLGAWPAVVAPASALLVLSGLLALWLWRIPSLDPLRR